MTAIWFDKGLRNYWGYQFLAFFAPEPRYLRSPLRPIQAMVNQFHAMASGHSRCGLYHTVEGNELGPTLVFKGIDNASYYRLLPRSEALLHHDTAPEIR